jgi:hypothetical protein
VYVVISSFGVNTLSAAVSKPTQMEGTDEPITKFPLTCTHNLELYIDQVSNNYRQIYKLHTAVKLLWADTEASVWRSALCMKFASSRYHFSVSDIIQCRPLCFNQSLIRGLRFVFNTDIPPDIYLHWTCIMGNEYDGCEHGWTFLLTEFLDVT